MTTTSITNFRNNLSTYLRLVKYKGETVKIVDEKMKKPMAEVTPPPKEESKKEYLKFVKSMYGIFKDLPEDENRKALKKADRLLVRNRLKK